MSKLHADEMSGLEQARFWESSSQRAEVIAGAELTVLSLAYLIIPPTGLFSCMQISCPINRDSTVIRMSLE
jgi:hypothetical protein